MKKAIFPTLVFGLVFLFMVQMAGTLVASIYTLDLLHTSLDAQALGVLFFFAPLILIFFRKKFPDWMVWVLFGVLLISRGITPQLNTSARMLSSGLGTASVFCLLVVLVTARSKGDGSISIGSTAGMGLALAFCLSGMLRVIDFGLDYSLTTAGYWVGWLLLLVLGISLFGLEQVSPSETKKTKTKGVTSSIMGIFMVFILFYFIFSAPAVITRWSNANYVLIVICLIILTMFWMVLKLYQPDLLNNVSGNLLLAWNIAFVVGLVAMLLAYRINFPPTATSAPVVSFPPDWVHQIPLILVLLLFPVIFFDLQRFWDDLSSTAPAPNQLVPGMLLGGFSLVLLVFMNIFTNVWGYVEPISPFFRNKFWLPFLLIGVILLTAIFIHRKGKTVPVNETNESSKRIWVTILIAILVLTVNGLYLQPVPPVASSSIHSLKVMTFNIQQANDEKGEQSFLRILELIRKVNPDILALQETDATRISLNNVDYVRFFADQLGYFSYYGPTPESGSYGTAILSRFPLENVRTIFTFSDQDENATAYAQVTVGNKKISILDVHPDGSDTADQAFATMVLEYAASQPDIIVLGDFNLRDYEPAYQMIAKVLKNAWISVYPTGISTDGLDMSGRNRIDHIFVSNDLQVSEPVYLLPPDSGSDHPAHWATITWNK